ncbi:MAG: hypothetical protein P4L53_13215 [Candidatus Obscuribacterales bacterium]|nr:hypothetical protein [Candidatus Obscuribacterales bacterium]
MSSQYRNSEWAREVPAPLYVNEAMQRPAQLAYAEYQSYPRGDAYSASLPPVAFEDRPHHHHYPPHRYHHRRHGEVSVSTSEHVHQAYHEHHHRPHHRYASSHAQQPGVNLSYSHHGREGHQETASRKAIYVDFNCFAPTPAESAKPLHITNGPVTSDVAAVERKMAQIALSVAHRLGTVGDCAHGPRLTLDKFGYHLPPAVATEQGRMIRDSGLFDLVPANEIRPGDYGVRDWSRSIVRQHGSDKGDSFIVTGIARNGSVLAANDHTFVVPADGGRYTNLQYYRPNAEFVRRFGNLT